MSDSEEANILLIDEKGGQQICSKHIHTVLYIAASSNCGEQ